MPPIWGKGPFKVTKRPSKGEGGGGGGASAYSCPTAGVHINSDIHVIVLCCAKLYIDIFNAL